MSSRSLHDPSVRAVEPSKVVAAAPQRAPAPRVTDEALWWSRRTASGSDWMQAWVQKPAQR